MRKPLTTVFQLLAAGMMLLGNALAQQTPAATIAHDLNTAQSTYPQSTIASQPARCSCKPAAPAKTSSATAAKKPPPPRNPQSPLTLKTQKQKASYALGMNIGADLKRKE